MLIPVSLLDQWKQRKGLRQIVGNIGWLGSDRVLRMFGGVVVGTAVARYLGPGQFGLLNYALAIYTLFNLISNLGLDFLVVRDIALDPDAEHELLGSSFLMKVGASFVTTLAAIAITWFLHPADKTLITIVALMSFASIAQGFDVIDYFFQAKTRSSYAVVPRTIVFVLASVARISAVVMHLSLLVFAWIAALEIFFSEIGLAIAYFRFRGGLQRWVFHRDRARRLLQQGWPLLLASLLVTVYMRIDQIMLGSMAGSTAVGQYSAAVKLSEIWYTLPIIICSSVMPRLLVLLKNNRQVYMQRMQWLYSSVTLLSLLIAIATQFVSPILIRLLYGAQYMPAAAILSVHIWTGLFVFVGCVGGQQLIQENLTKIELQRSALGAVVNIGLNFWLIPRYGAIGSAWATLIAQASASYLADALDPRTLHIFRMKTRAYLSFWTLPKMLLAQSRQTPPAASAD